MFTYIQWKFNIKSSLFGFNLKNCIYKNIYKYINKICKIHIKMYVKFVIALLLF